MNTALKPDFAGVDFSALKALRDEFLRDASDLFDQLVSGEKKVSSDVWLDHDPFHDKPPRRVIQLTALIEIRQEDAHTPQVDKG